MVQNKYSWKGRIRFLLANKPITDLSPILPKNNRFYADFSLLEILFNRSSLLLHPAFLKIFCMGLFDGPLGDIQGNRRFPLHMKPSLKNIHTFNFPFGEAQVFTPDNENFMPRFWFGSGPVFPRSFRFSSIMFRKKERWRSGKPPLVNNTFVSWVTCR